MPKIRHAADVELCVESAHPHRAELRQPEQLAQPGRYVPPLLFECGQLPRAQQLFDLAGEVGSDARQLIELLRSLIFRESPRQSAHHLSGALAGAHTERILPTDTS